MRQEEKKVVRKEGGREEKKESMTGGMNREGRHKVVFCTKRRDDRMLK